jgi:hypothetical protein
MHRKRAADPVEEFLFAFVLRWLDGVMEARQAHAFVHERADCFQMIPLKKRMSAAAVCVDDDGRRAIERCGVRRPAV